MREQRNALIFFIDSCFAFFISPVRVKAEAQAIFVPDDYASIQEAIYDAEKGDLAYIHPL